MNANIVRLAGAAIVLLASLVVATTYWQTWAAPRSPSARTTPSSAWSSSQ